MLLVLRGLVYFCIIFLAKPNEYSAFYIANQFCSNYFSKLVDLELDLEETEDKKW